MELLAEDSKNVYPAMNTVSENSKAMAQISKELFKRECLATMQLVAFGYFIIRFAIHGK